MRLEWQVVLSTSLSSLSLTFSTTNLNSWIPLYYYYHILLVYLSLRSPLSDEHHEEIEKQNNDDTILNLSISTLLKTLFLLGNFHQKNKYIVNWDYSIPYIHTNISEVSDSFVALVFDSKKWSIRSCWRFFLIDRNARTCIGVV